MKKILDYLATHTTTVAIVITLLALAETLCLEYGFGFPILTDISAKIVSNFMYAMMASGAFFLVIVEIPRIRDKRLRDSIGYRQVFNFIHYAKIRFDNLFEPIDLEGGGRERELTEYLDVDEVQRKIESVGVEEFSESFDMLADYISRRYEMCLNVHWYLDADTYDRLLRLPVDSFLIVVIGQESRSYSERIVELYRSIRSFYLNEKPHLRKVVGGGAIAALFDWDAPMPERVPQ